MSNPECEEQDGQRLLLRLGDGIHEPADLAFQVCALAQDRAAAARRVLLPALEFGVILVDEGLNQLRREHAVPEAVQDAGLQLRYGHCPVVGTIAFLAGVGTAIAVTIGNRDPAATHPAFDQPAE